MMPLLEAFAQQHADKLKLIPVDADKHKDLLNKKSISGIPYLELYHDGKLVWSHEGGMTADEIAEQINL
jgi:thioredoxin 1